MGEVVSSLEHSRTCDEGHCFWALEKVNVGTNIFSCRNTTDFAVHPQCQNSGKKSPGGMTQGDRRAARLPSPRVPCWLPRPPSRPGIGVLWSSWRVAPCLNGCSPLFAHGFRSLALMSVSFNIMSVPLFSNPLPPQLVGQRCTLQD